ncbi:MAG: non-canonical purine NTP pyrophosphatase [SAR324 cluster bacterium]|nr:non-canonical purine NTP pyrophosphatase [SAR324 cluster bacterium]
MKINSLVLITGNEGKALEFQSLLNIPDLKFGWQKLPLTEIQSTQISEIGKAKTTVALFHPELKGEWDAVLTDDTGLYLKALGGLPGPLVKFFLEALGAEGIFNLTQQGGPEAKATCMLSLGLSKTKEIIQFEGDVQGQLTSPQGSSGFGWDSIFQPDGLKKTYAELSLAEKNQISHRTIATNALRDWIIST